MTKPRFVMLSGTAANQKALANKFYSAIELSGIVLSKNMSKQSGSFSGKIRRVKTALLTRTVGKPFVDAWHFLMSTYEKQFPAWPNCKNITVDNINNNETLDFLKESKPDYILVSGTNLIGKTLISWASANCKGILNLHTGISPYIKGGPNCTNWCLSTGQFSLIGNTIMKLDAGIDTGEIIATERTPLSGDESLEELHQKVMEHAHDLYLRAARVLQNGEALESITQNSIAEGKTFYTKEWGAAAMLSALKNFKNKYSKESISSVASGLKLVALKTRN